MEVQILKPYKPLYTSNTRYFLLYGGRAGGRSYGASQKAVIDTLSADYSRIAIMRYIAGDIRSSIWQEIKDRIEEYSLPEVTQDQAMKYNFNGNTIDSKGFKQSSGQNTAKLKSLAGYNTIIIEEADEIDQHSFDQLDTSIRTNKGKNQIILMFNMPSKDHWLVKRWFNLEKSEVEGYYLPKPKDRADTTYIEASYKDNEKNLNPATIQLMERYKQDRPDYYYTMIKGYVSEGLRGRVFNNWQPINQKDYDELPYSPTYGLDFGFTNDPTALVEVKQHNNKLYVRELLYQQGMLNSDIAEAIKRYDIKTAITADSSEPKSIEEIKRMGVNIKPALKGADSVRAGIQKINSYQVYYVETSSNLIHEYQNYQYKLDINKNPTNEPKDEHNHLMDSLRYSLEHKKLNPIII